MKKSILRAVFPIVLGLVLLLVGTGTKAYSAGFLSFEIKLSGGIGYLFNGGGDLEKARLGYEAYTTDWVEQYYTSSFDWKKVSVLPDFRGEFILKFGNYIGVGFGAGYQSMSSTGNYSLMYDYSNNYSWGTYLYSYDDVYARDYTIKNIPIFMNIYGFLPMRNMSLFAYIGPSINIGSLNYTYTLDSTEVWPQFTSSYYYNWTDKFTYKQTVTNDAKCTAFGFQGGIGIQINLGSHFAIGLEGYGRYVNFSNWTGTSDSSWNGEYTYYYEPWGWYDSYAYSGSEHLSDATLYHYTWEWSYNGHRYERMYMFETGDPPSGSSYSDVRKAEINFNAIGALISIIIHF